MSMEFKQASKVLQAALFTGLLALAACENDLKKVQEISAKEVTNPGQRTTGVDMIYSDSGYVKARMTTPFMVEHNEVKKPFIVMPKGVKIDFYDQNLKLTSTVVADSAIYLQNDKIVELHRNVVASNEKGETFKSDELFWSQTTRKVTSSKPVTIASPDGNVTYGTGIEADEKFTHWIIPAMSGVIHVKENFGQ